MMKAIDPHAILETLKARRAELDAEIAAVERFIAICDAAGAPRAASSAAPDGKTPRRPSKAAPARAGSAETPAKPRRSRGARAPGTAGRATVVAAVRDILAAGGTPLGRNALLGALTERGINLGGQRPLANLQNMLWKSKAEIVNLPGHGHWLADRDYPPAGYRAGAR